MTTDKKTTKDTPSENPSTKSAPKQSSSSKNPKRVERYGDVLSDGTIIEAIYRPDHAPACSFIIVRPGTEPCIAESFEKGGETIYPPEQYVRKFLQKTVTLPSGLENYRNPRWLLDEIKSHLSKYLDLKPFEISLLAHYAMMTWVWDGWNAFPYLRLQGEPATGKTHCLEVMKEFCYRSYDLGVSPTKSALFRGIHKVRGTAFIDEADYEGGLRSDLIKLLNNGYRRDGVVTVSKTNEKDDWEDEAYSVGCPKILANRQSFRDPALETRCITIYTVSKKLSPHIPTEYPDEFYRNGRSLRNKLLRWRLENFHSINRDETGLAEIDGRAKQLGLPIYNISPDPQFKEEFLNFLQTRARSMREHDPLQVVISAIAYISDLDYRDRIPLKEISSKAMEIATERDMPTYLFEPRKTASLIRGLGFGTKKRNKGVDLLLDKSILREQRERFIIDGDESDDGDDSGEREEQQPVAA